MTATNPPPTIRLIPNNSVEVLFVSDLHLDASRPAATDTFCRFLKKEAAQADALYILGDLFEYWIGDEDQNPHYRSIVTALTQLTVSGVPCYIMHGNRDFMLGKQFERESGATLIHDPTLIYAGGKSILLSHGDSLCTDDYAYQRFRRIVRSKLFQRIYKSLPFSLKSLLAKKARNKSTSSMDNKPPEILDVNQQAVNNTMQLYDVDTLLHGHTHRAAVHDFEFNGVKKTRIVLGDWYETGSVVRWDTTGPHLTTLNF
jgi:UDP-2,3-diacylglucosamine hydrolase